MSKDAYEYLAKIDLNTWCEGLGSTHSPSLTTCEQPMRVFQRIHFKVARLVNNNDVGNEKEEVDEEILNEKDAIHCYNTYAGDGLLEVSCKRKQYVVNLIRRICGCRQ
jgi:hypothetical protein